MRLEGAAHGDRVAALALLKRGVTLGDIYSRVRLNREHPRK